MNLRRTLLTSVTLSLLCLCATNVNADPVFVDPVGDTFGAGSVQLDITSVNGTVLGSNLAFRVTFATQVAPPSALAPNSVVGFIDLDTDQNASTGVISLQAIFGPGPAPLLGDEFFVDLGSEISHAGLVDIVNATTFSVTATVAITFSATSFSLEVPLAAIGGDNGIVNYGVIIGTFAEPTDEALNGTAPAVSGPAAIPEPATLLLLGSGLAGFLLKSRRRKLD
jgi:hypothetical protein